MLGFYFMIETLKAKAYDITAQMEFLQKELQKVNQEILAEMQKTNVNVKDETATGQGGVGEEKVGDKS